MSVRRLCECGRPAVAVVFVPQLTNQRATRLSIAIYLCYSCLHDEMDADMQAGIDLCRVELPDPWRRILLTPN